MLESLDGGTGAEEDEGDEEGENGRDDIGEDKSIKQVRKNSKNYFTISYHADFRFLGRHIIAMEMQMKKQKRTPLITLMGL